MKKETRVKIIFWTLVIAAIFGVLSVATGVQSWSHSTLRGTEILRYDIAGRIFTGVVTIICALIASGLKKRKMIAWILITIGLGISIPWAMIQAIVLAFSLDIPAPALLLGFMGECVKVAILVLVLWKWWIPTKPLFNNPHLRG